MIRVAIADDNAVIREGLASVLESDPDIRVVAHASTGKEAVVVVRNHQPDVALLDVRMPVRDGLSAAEEIAAGTPVIMLTYAEDPDTIWAALRAGAAGYLVHGQFTPDELHHAVREVAAGRPVLTGPAATVALDAMRNHRAPSRAAPGRLGLTERESEIMDLLVQGLSNQAISEELYITHKTVKNHLSRIYARIGVTSRGEAVAAWNAAATEAAGRAPP
jgi:DNA-binding NarL/FixJ family response regulator